MVLSRVVIIIFFSLNFFLSVYVSHSLTFAHEDNQQITNEYSVNVSQDPLSPFVDEEVKINFTLKTKIGNPAANINGNLLIKEIPPNSESEIDSEEEAKLVYQKELKTDADGSVELAYHFKKEGLYDVEFIWGDDAENESAGKEIYVREPTSFFTKEEVLKRIWIFVIVALAGFAIGVIMTFALLTMSLHPRK